MSDTKKRRSFTFFAKRQVSLNTPLADEAAVDHLAVATKPSNSKPAPPVITRARSSSSFNQAALGAGPKRGSFGVIEDLVQCPICLEKLNNPKMLSCQHTFCLFCLHLQIKDNKLICPSCNTSYPVTSSKFCEELPSNLYIDNLLTLLVSPSAGSEKTGVGKRAVSITTAPSQTSIPREKRCCKCQTMVAALSEHYCNHCKQIFCGACWPAHISELKSQIGTLAKQIESGSERLKLRFDDYKDRCEWLVNKITTTTEKKIEEIQLEKENLLLQANKLLTNGESTSKLLQGELRQTRERFTKVVNTDFDSLPTDNEKVATFRNFHQKTVDILNDVARWGESKFSFDQENFRIEIGLDQPRDTEADDPVVVEVKGIENPLADADSLTLYYRSRKFSPSMIWKRCPRPAGVAMAPWSGLERFFVCSTDSRHVLVVDRESGRIVQRMSDANMLCPHSIAFSEIREEIYVTDKYNHCVHVFSKTGIFKKSLGAKGNKQGYFRSPEGIAVDSSENVLYVCDTGNDRVQIIDIESGAYIRFIGIVSRNHNSNSIKYTQLNAPTSIAVTEERVIILDSGNKRVQVYSLNGEKVHEFGSGGSHKGQFLHPEVVAVDPLGFILVGDSGNARVQVFKPNGQLIRVFDGSGLESGKFGWISGIHITPQLEVIISDPRNHQVCIF